MTLTLVSENWKLHVDTKNGKKKCSKKSMVI